MPQIPSRHIDPEKLLQLGSKLKENRDFREWQEREKVADISGWNKPEPKNFEAMFETLKKVAGEWGATFAGRVIKPGDRLEDVLKRIPAAELSGAGGCPSFTAAPSVPPPTITITNPTSNPVFKQTQPSLPKGIEPVQLGLGVAFPVPPHS